jgi:hypothetical protein
LNGQHFVGTASFTFGDFDAPTTLTSLAKVGDCPGAAVSGSVEVCAGGFGSPQCPEAVAITGTLDGQPVSESHAYASYGFAPDILGGQSGAMTFRSQDGGLLATDGQPTAVSGLLIWPETGARAGSTLCFDQGQYVNTEDPLVIETGSVTEVGKAADAAPLAGEITLTRVHCPN